LAAKLQLSELRQDSKEVEASRVDSTVKKKMMTMADKALDVALGVEAAYKERVLSLAHGRKRDPLTLAQARLNKEGSTGSGKSTNGKKTSSCSGVGVGVGGGGGVAGAGGGKPQQGSEFASVFGALSDQVGEVKSSVKKQMMIEAENERLMAVLDKAIYREAVEEAGKQAGNGNPKNADEDVLQAYYCATCRSWSMKPAKSCVDHGHRLQRKARKRLWFKCGHCKMTTSTFGGLVPTTACKRCRATGREWIPCDRPEKKQRGSGSLGMDGITASGLKLTVDGRRHDYHNADD